MHDRELQAALEAVAAAGAYQLDEYARFTPIPNAPASISTEVDKNSQEIILSVLHKHFPLDAFCAEEVTPTLQKAPEQADRMWIIDPIDGTRGFVMKLGEFSVMVGLIGKGEMLVGAVYQPAVGRLTYAQKGGGCWRKDGDAAPVRCQVTDMADLSQATLTQSRPKPPGSRSKWLDALNPKRLVETYSAGIKLALVARGDADVYLNTYEAFKDWDICAGHLLVAEAGGAVTGTLGQPIRYGLPGAWQKDGLLASNGKLHEAAVGKLRTVA